LLVHTGLVKEVLRNG